MVNEHASSSTGPRLGCSLVEQAAADAAWVKSTRTKNVHLPWFEWDPSIGCLSLSLSPGTRRHVSLRRPVSSTKQTESEDSRNSLCDKILSLKKRHEPGARGFNKKYSLGSYKILSIHRLCLQYRLYSQSYTACYQLFCSYTLISVITNGANSQSSHLRPDLHKTSTPIFHVRNLQNKILLDS